MSTNAPSQRALSIRTPEGIQVSFEVSGIGARILAFVLDTLLAFIAPIILLALVFVPLAGFNGLSGAAFLVALTIVRLLGFSLYEAFYRGRTPGKRALGLRVVCRSGEPLDFRTLLVRNLSRELDCFLPLFLLLGLLGSEPVLPFPHTMTLMILMLALLPIFNRHRLRIGDLLAGTAVIKVPRSFLMADLGSTARELPALAPRLRSGSPVQGGVFTAAQLARCDLADLRRLEADLRLMRTEASLGVLQHSAEHYAVKVDYMPPAGTVAPDAVSFLEALYAELRASLEHQKVLGTNESDS